MALLAGINLATAAAGRSLRYGVVSISYPAALRPHHVALGNYFTTAGWRPSWDGSPVGPGTLLVSFSDSGVEHEQRGSAVDAVTESIQVGSSRDAAVVAHCGVTGLHGPSGRRLPDRMLGGHRWTVYLNGDAGMSQSLAATDYRTVIDGTCYAITRMSYQANGNDPTLRGPNAAIARGRIDAVLNGIRIDGRGRR